MSKELSKCHQTPVTVDSDWLDLIFEDLMVGHNFDYAAKAIRVEVERLTEEARYKEVASAITMTRRELEARLATLNK